MLSSKELLLCFSFDGGNLVVIQNQKGRELLASFFDNYIAKGEKEDKYIKIKKEILADKTKHVGAYWMPNDIEEFKHLYDRPSVKGDVQGLAIDLTGAVVELFKDETEAFLARTDQRNKMLEEVVDEHGARLFENGNDKIRVFKKELASDVKAIDNKLRKKKLEDMKWVVF